MNKFKEFDLSKIEIVKTPISVTTKTRNPKSIERENRLYEVLKNLEVGYEFTLPGLFYPYLQGISKLFSDRKYKIGYFQETPTVRNVRCYRIK